VVWWPPLPGEVDEGAATTDTVADALTEPVEVAPTAAPVTVAASVTVPPAAELLGTTTAAWSSVL
jgi:hypothetical protein